MLQTVDRLVEVLDERDEDWWRFAREHQRLDGRDLAAQLVEGAHPVPVRRTDCLHAVEYAWPPGPKAIVKSLWDGGDVMVIRAAN
jgi:hypothetical protein